MDDDDSTQDLKQFIAATVHQEVNDVRDDIKKLDSKLSTKIDNLSNSVAEALDTSNDTTDTQLKVYGTRIANLEQKIA